jgi:hypothetical protein
MKTPHAATRIQSQFHGFKAREYQTARRKLPIKSRSVYQSYLGSHMIENTLGQEGWVALVPCTIYTTDAQMCDPAILILMRIRTKTDLVEGGALKDSVEPRKNLYQQLKLGNIQHAATRTAVHCSCT